jgi:hypothetical protein
MIAPITLDLNGESISYTPPSWLYVMALGDGSSQEKIANAVDLVFRRLYPERYSELLTFGDQLAILAEMYDTTQSGVIDFALAYAMAHGEMDSALAHAVEVAGRLGDQARNDSDATIAEKAAAVRMARQIQHELQQIRSQAM